MEINVTEDTVTVNGVVYVRKPQIYQCPKAGVRYKRERPTEEQMERIAKSDLAKCHDTVLVWVNEGDLVSWDWDEMPNAGVKR